MTTTTLDVERMGHVNMFVEDAQGILDRYRDVFDAEKFLDVDEPGFGARNFLLLVGATCFEAFTPTRADGAIGTWLSRYGAGWHSLEWTIRSLDDGMAVLADRGIRVTDHRPGFYLFTHPRDLHGLSLELTTHHFPDDLRDEPGWTPTRWSHDHPLGISGGAVVKLASHEPEKAARDVADLVGGQVNATESDAFNSRGFRITFPDHAVEFVTSRTGSDRDHVGTFLSRHGERMMSLELGISDLGRAREFLVSKDVHFTQWGPDTLLLPADTMLGAPVELTVRTAGGAR